MFMRMLKRLPFINCLVSFSWKSHQRALTKIIILWVLSTLPVLWSILFSAAPEGAQGIWQKLEAKLHHSFSVTELFVYAAAFLSPIFYIVFEEFRATEGSRSRIRQTFRGVFSGYKLVFFLAFLVLLLTATAYGAARTSQEDFEATFLYILAPNLEYWVYAFAVFCWYLSILHGTVVADDFIGASRRDEEELKTGLNDRLAERG